MSRSPYDPSPEYTRCKHCDQEYDCSGYYGTDDEAHFCRAKAELCIRHVIAHGYDIDDIVATVRIQLQHEEAAKAAEQRELKIKAVRNTLEMAKKDVETYEKLLAELTSAPE